MAKIVFQMVISDVLSNFPFVNLQIKSMVESLRPIMSCTQSKKKISDLLKKDAFLGKNSAFRNSQISLNLLVGSY